MENQVDQTTLQSSDSSKLWFVVITAIVITALLVGMIVYVWQHSIAQKSQAELQQQITDLQQQRIAIEVSANSPAPLITNEYTSSKFGFKISIPINWTAQEGPLPHAEGFEGIAFISPETQAAIKACNETSGCSERSGSDIVVSLEESFGCSEGTTTPVVINGTTWKRITGCDAVYSYTDYATERQNKIYVFTTTSHETELKQMLSALQWL